jgi:ABC-type sugar transport system permease subunit
MTPRERFVLLAPFTGLIAVFLIWPALRDFSLTFTNFDPLRPQVFQWIGLEHYARAISSSDFRASMFNMAVFVPVSVTLELLFGSLIAFALREPFRGRSLVRALLLVPWLINPIAAGVMARFLSSDHVGLFAVNLRASALALPSLIALEVWRNTPLVTFLILPGLSLIPASRWDLAKLEGLSITPVFRHVIVPGLRPLLLAVTLLILANAISGFESVLMFTGGGPGSQTMLPGLLAYLAGYKTFDWGTGSSLSWLIWFAVLLVGLAYLKLVRDRA